MTDMLYRKCTEHDDCLKAYCTGYVPIGVTAGEVVAAIGDALCVMDWLHAHPRVYAELSVYDGVTVPLMNIDNIARDLLARLDGEGDDE